MVRMHEFQMIPALHYKCKNMTYLDFFFFTHLQAGIVTRTDVFKALEASKV